MTRMTREFTLVLLGAGLLTAGYFAWPEQDFERRADEQAQNRVGGNRARTGGGFIFIGHFGGGGATSSRAGGARSPAMGSVSKGGFGSIGGRVGGGFGG
jgi:hypothetical protein